MKHTIKEAIKLSDAYKKGRIIQRRMAECSEWEDIKDFNENYVLEEEFEYRVFPFYFRLPTVNDFKSIAREFSKLDSDSKSRVYLDEKSGNKLHFYYNYLRGLGEPEGQYFCWCSDQKGFRRSFNGFDVVLENIEKPKLRSVRLVSDEPFEGGIKFGNVWWKPENEEGLYTWKEAMEKFNK